MKNKTHQITSNTIRVQFLVGLQVFGHDVGTAKRPVCPARVSNYEANDRPVIRKSLLKEIQERLVELMGSGLRSVLVILMAMEQVP